MGLVTATWLAGNKVLTAYRSESVGSWTAPATPAAIDPGDGTLLFGLQIASNAFGRAVTTWTAGTTANRFSLRGAGGGTPWSAPGRPIGGVPADAVGQDLAVDSTGRRRLRLERRRPGGGQRLDAGDLHLRQPAQQRAAAGAARARPPPTGQRLVRRRWLRMRVAAKAKAKLQGSPTTTKGVAFVLTMPARLGADRHRPRRPGPQGRHVQGQVRAAWASPR